MKAQLLWCWTQTLERVNKILVWLNANAGAIQAGFTVLLVIITAIYARDTNKIAEIAKRQIKQSEDELEQLREQTRVTREQLKLEYEPNLVLNVKLDSSYNGSLWLTNLGRHVVHVNGIICGKNLITGKDRKISYLNVDNPVMQSGEPRCVASFKARGNEDNETISIHLKEVLEAGGKSREGKPFDEVKIDFQYSTTSDLVHTQIFEFATHFTKDFSEIRVKLKKKERGEATPLVKMKAESQSRK